MIAYVDMFSGIAGDMVLGAFVDLGVPVSYLQQTLSKCLSGFVLRTETVLEHHLRCVNLFVDVHDEKTSRHYKDIRQLIKKADVSDWVKAKSLDAFEKIALAESKIHNTELDKVHFHEIGGIDAIVDIMGSFLSAEYLGITKVYASKIPLGNGFVDTAHGKLPVPVPATAAIIKNIPVTTSDATTEIVTPTGAAVITTLASDFGTLPDMTISKTGYGKGKRETGSSLPNLLRILLGEENTAKEQAQQVIVIKTNVDDMNPEILGFVMERLLDHGALDVCYVPVQMKKNRPGVQIEVICTKEKCHELADLILSETSTLGVRYHLCERRVLERQEAFVDTSFGKIQVKKITGPDNCVRYLPEYEVCKKIALKEKLPLERVYECIRFDINNLDTD
ncbi:MAG: nickel pincer cofactor biosynthesis protein LarC [Desulfobacteraceae bacterium]|nr:nickel pincer cofactor biosynthesis protein LarC [Desulfobacteraceae bacterium]